MPCPAPSNVGRVFDCTGRCGQVSDTENMLRLLALACLLLSASSFAGASRVVQFEFAAKLVGREASRGQVATLVDEREPATIRITDDQGRVHELAFTVRGAGRALKLEARLDGKLELRNLATKPGTRVTLDGADGTTMELTLVQLRAGT